MKRVWNHNGGRIRAARAGAAARFLAVAIVGVLLGSSALASEVRLHEVFSATGQYGIHNSGVGDLVDGTATMHDVTIPGRVETAYLYWVGSNQPHDDVGSDANITLTSSASSRAAVTADVEWAVDFEKPWDPGHYLWDANHIAFVADVTDLVSVGTFDYTISDFDMDAEFGVGLQVVYEDDSLPVSNVTVHQGHDFAYSGWPSAGELNRTHVLTHTFEPSDHERTLEASFLVAGGEPTDRPDQLWFDTGTHVTEEDLPAELITTGLGEVIDANPLEGTDGATWDTVIKEVMVPAGATYVAFQFESGGGTGTGSPAESFSWVSGSFAMVPEPTMLVLLLLGIPLVTQRRR